MKNKNQSPEAAREHYITDSVPSKDGATIGYRQLGHGPGVLLLHGTASSAHNHMQLAEALADGFTVYVPDRRGRGLSGQYSGDYSIQKEVEDLKAVLTKTDVHNVFGVSSGGLILLQGSDGCRVKNHQVGRLPRLDQTAVVKSKKRSWHRREPPNGVLQRHDLFVADPVGKEVRAVAVVGAEHDVGSTV